MNMIIGANPRCGNMSNGKCSRGSLSAVKSNSRNIGGNPAGNNSKGRNVRNPMGVDINDKVRRGIRMSCGKRG